MKEVWKKIKGFEGLYRVSNLGRVQSLGRSYEVRIKGTLTTNQVKPRLLKPTLEGTGYFTVCLYANKIRIKKGVHVLVATAFLQNPKKKPQVNHKDCNPKNNHVTNLEWCTHAENLQHASRMGRMVAWNKGLKGDPRIEASLAKGRAVLKGKPVWNKGKKTGIVPRSAFKKGGKPWNKGLKKEKGLV